MDEPALLVIRPVTAADVDRLAALQEASILRLGTPVYGAEKARAWARLGHEFKHVLLGEGAFFTAERAGRSLGVGGWSPDSLGAGARLDPLSVRRSGPCPPGHRPAPGRARRALGRRRRPPALRRLVELQRRAVLCRARLSPGAPGALAGQRGLELDNVLMRKRWQERRRRRP